MNVTWRYAIIVVLSLLGTQLMGMAEKVVLREMLISGKTDRASEMINALVGLSTESVGLIKNNEKIQKALINSAIKNRHIQTINYLVENGLFKKDLAQRYFNQFVRDLNVRKIVEHLKFFLNSYAHTLVDLNMLVEDYSGLGRLALNRAASYHGDKELVEALLKAGADPNAQDYYGLTALMEVLDH